MITAKTAFKIKNIDDMSICLQKNLEIENVRC